MKLRDRVVFAAQLLRGRVVVPLEIVARAAGVPADVFRGARIEDAVIGPAQLTFRLVPREGAAMTIDLLEREIDDALLAILELVSPSFDVRRVAIEGDAAIVYLRLRTFGAAVTLDAIAHRRGAISLVRSTGSSNARGAAPAPRATG